MTTQEIESTNGAQPVALRRAEVDLAPAGRSRGRWLLFASDVALGALVLAASQVVSGDGGVGVWGDPPFTSAALALWCALAVGLAILFFAGAYGSRSAWRSHVLERPGRVFVAGLAGGWAGLLAASAAGHSPDVAQLTFVSVGLSIVWLGDRAALARSVPQRILIIGSGQVADRFVQISRRQPHMGLRVVGMLDDAPAPNGSTSAPVLGGFSDLAATVEAHEVDRVVVTFTPTRDEELLGLLRECERLGVQLDIVPRMFELMRDGARTTRVGGLPVVGVTHSRASTAEVAAKRAIDIGGAALGLLLALPILLIVGTLVAVQDGGSPIFRQARVGQNGRLFDVLKIRTMSTRKNDRETDIDGPTPTPAGPDMATLVEQLKSDTQAVTRLGRVLRMTSIDELPQLWNVLVGEMSLVGPRPLRPFEVAALDNWEMRRQEMRPGITGLWQVEGRSEIGWSERMQLDYAYIRNWSLLSDLSLLAKTPMAVLRRQGAR